jgi:DNA processing protein
MPIDLDQSRAARAALTLLGPGRNPAVHELICSFGPVEAWAWLTSPQTPQADTAEYLSGVSVEQLRAHAAALSDETRRAGARVLIPEDDDWPARLDDLGDVAFAAAPSSALCLWARGNTFAIPARTVAITGSRDAPPQRVAVASELGRGLAAAGWTVAATSGNGISAAALAGALAAGGPVIAVLACGIDQPTHAGNGPLLAQVGENGLLVSAYPPGTRPGYTAAGRLLAGLTSGTVLVETGAPSSASAVLAEAADRGRHAMILPAPSAAHLPAGTHRAAHLDRSARLVQDTAEVLAGLSTLR